MPFLAPVAVLHAMMGSVASLTSHPTNPWPVAICAAGFVAFVAIVAIAATIANRREDRHRGSAH